MSEYTLWDFMVKFLNPEAMITISDHSGIIYNGKSGAVIRKSTNGLYLESVEGLGELDDLIIYCKTK